MIEIFQKQGDDHKKKKRIDKPRKHNTQSKDLEF
jgi:hypothetical protein